MRVFAKQSELQIGIIRGYFKPKVNLIKVNVRAPVLMRDLSGSQKGSERFKKFWEKCE